MISNPLQRLRGLTKHRSPTLPIWVLSILLAVSCSFLLIVFGWYWEYLASHQLLAESGHRIALGRFLSIDAIWLEADQSPLRGVAALLSFMFIAVFGTAILFYAVAKLATQISIDRAQSQLRAVHHQLQSLVRRRSPTLLQPVVDHLVNKDIPTIRDATATWLRYGPRYLCLSIACIIVAALIDPLLTLLSLIVVVLAQQLYVWFDRRRRRGRPVILEQRNTALQRLSQWLGQGPLLATIHRGQTSVEAFDHQLSGLRIHDQTLDDYAGWKSPVTLGLAGVFGLMVMFASAVRVLRPGSDLSIVAVLLLFLAILLSVYGFQRFLKAWRGLQLATPHITSLTNFLTQAITPQQNDPSIKLPKEVRAIELRNVTLHSHTDEITLDNITATFHAGEIIAIVSNNSLSQHALADLMLGFGYPSKGECIIEGIPLHKLGVDRLGELACWVASDGPLFTASVHDNLRTVQNAQVMSADLSHILQWTKCDAAVNALQDGVATLISPNDDRLLGDIPFRLGLARALTLKKPIVVVQEPAANGDARMEADTREAIEFLANQGMMVILLPSRSKTLWSAHQVLFIQAGKLAACGKHATLLEQHDAYRHWNYMRFSPHLNRA